MSRKVLLAGGSGLIGKNIYQLLTRFGYEPIILSRNEKLSERNDFIYWDPSKSYIKIDGQLNVRAIINLCGAGIAEKKWTDDRKKELVDSRIIPAHFIAELIKTEKIKTDVYLGSSAIGIYGDRPGTNACNESDQINGDTFLSKICIEWEKAQDNIPDTVRKVLVRTGIVLAEEGGALDQYRPLLNLRMAPYFGGGKPYMSWITIDDLSNMFLHGIESNISGTYNAVGDLPVNSKEFAKAFIRSQSKWAVSRSVPNFAVKLMLGEMSAVVLESQFVSNEKIKATGFDFKAKTIDEAFEQIKK
ncbi:MAG: TIGR01777 family protein [Saprospiraceae bacterium]|nr:TIGR01777 family oxidoreductase [Candidatus Brachybacter algidus]MBK8749802.1 TIGR01777 family protein [Candidatus Brachybacter algidus]